MSTVIALKTDDFSLLITDTRLCRYDESGTLRYTDNTIKMRYINGVGFLAGVGAGELIYGMYDCTPRPVDTGILRPTLRTAFINAYHNLNMTASDTDRVWLDKTGICVSWVDTATQLRVFGRNFANQVFADLKQCQALVLYPDGLTKDFMETIDASLKGIGGSKNSMLLAMLCAFKKISATSNFVSNVACIGIISNNTTEPLFYMDDVEKLINTLKNDGDLVNIFAKHERELMPMSTI